MTGCSAATIARLFEDACRAELHALKPGNVHIHGVGHGMTAADFLASAVAAAPALACPGRKVGDRILAAITATRAACGQNTNLGIVLLCAPLAAAAQLGLALRPGLNSVLAALDREDAVAAYRAIRLASPGGLGRSELHDVASEPDVTLLAAMREAAGRDRIARQYATGFADVFGIGLERLMERRAAGWPEDWAMTDTFLAFLAAFPDTHIVRKHGEEVAAEVRDAAARLERERRALGRPAAIREALMEFDRALKGRGINPGTSADLSVASHFAAAIAMGAI